VHVTIVVPRGKKLPDGGEQITCGAGSTPSAAVTTKDTISPDTPTFRSCTDTDEGH